MEILKIKLHLDEVVMKLGELIPMDFIEKNLFISGGAIRSLVNNETPKDYDFFLKFPELLQELDQIAAFKYFYKSKNSIGFRLPDGKELQIIICSMGTPDEVIGEFDFMNNMNYYDLSSKEIIINSHAFSKTLKINTKCRNLLGTLSRIPKFVARGFVVPSIEDLTILGVRLTQSEPIVKLSQLMENARISSCCTENVVQMTNLEADIDLSTVNITLRGSGA